MSSKYSTKQHTFAQMFCKQKSKIWYKNVREFLRYCNFRAGTFFRFTLYIAQSTIRKSKLWTHFRTSYNLSPLTQSVQQTSVLDWIKDRALCHLWEKLGKSRHHYRHQSTALTDTCVACGYLRLRELDHEENRRRLDAFEMKALRQILRVLCTAKKNKSVGLGVGRCQQMFTSKCEKREVGIFQSHMRSGHVSRKGHSIFKGHWLGIGKEEDRKQRWWIMSLHGRDWSLKI